MSGNLPTPTQDQELVHKATLEELGNSPRPNLNPWVPALFDLHPRLNTTPSLPPTAAEIQAIHDMMMEEFGITHSMVALNTGNDRLANVSVPNAPLNASHNPAPILFHDSATHLTSNPPEGQEDEEEGDGEEWESSTSDEEEEGSALMLQERLRAQVKRFEKDASYAEKKSVGKKVKMGTGKGGEEVVVAEEDEDGDVIADEEMGEMGEMREGGVLRRRESFLGDDIGEGSGLAGGSGVGKRKRARDSLGDKDPNKDSKSSLCFFGERWDSMEVC